MRKMKGRGTYATLIMLYYTCKLMATKKASLLGCSNVALPDVEISCRLKWKHWDFFMLVGHTKQKEKTYLIMPMH